MSEITQIRLTGSGGQGLITAGVILAEAAVLEGKFVVQTQSYGPEARLGSSKAEVIIANHHIAYPQVTVPDILICLSEEATQKYAEDVHYKTVVIVDSSNVEMRPTHGKVYYLPITETAANAGNKMGANVVALGVMNAVKQVVSPTSLRQAILHRVPEKHRAFNELALDAAANLVATLV